MKSFSAIVLMAFVVLALFGVFIFATFTTSGSANIGEVTIWGSLPQEQFEPLIGAVRQTRDDFTSVTYRSFPRESLVPELVAAIAAGRGPDLILFPASSFVKDGDKLQPISYSTLSRRSFQDQFVQAGEIFLTPTGVAALPLVIDPTVLYWNRTLFGNAAIANPPKFWDELSTIAPRITKRTQNGSLVTSATALGGWDNVLHAKEVLLSLMNQIGTPVVAPATNGGYESALNKASESGVSPADSALRYYADFADPQKPNYSWNRSQKLSRDAFLAGTVGVYFGLASELYGIRAANPNLNFDVAPLPTARGGGTGVAADLLGFAIPRGAKNPTGAATVALVMSGPASSRATADMLHLPSPRRDVEPVGDADAYQAVFRSSALRAFAFLDPDPSASDALFARMVDAVASGRSTVSQAVRNAHDELQVLLKVQ